MENIGKLFLIIAIKNRSSEGVIFDTPFLSNSQNFEHLIIAEIEKERRED